MSKKYFLGAINICFIFFMSFLLFYMLLYIGLFKYTNIIFAFVILMILMLLCLRMYFSSSLNKYNIGMYFSFFINVLLVYGCIVVNSKYSFLDNYINKISYTSYKVIVKRQNTYYSSINRLEQKRIGGINSTAKLTTISYNYVEYKDVNSLINALEKSDIQSIVLCDRDYQNLLSNDKIKDLKVLYTFRNSIV